MAYIYFHNNPLGKNVGDCAVRAVSKVMDWDWDRAYKELAVQGFCMADMPNANATIGGLLFLNGFHRYNIETVCPDCYTVNDFCDEHPEGVYVVMTGSHAIAVIDGTIYDSFDSGNEIPAYVWKKER